MYNSYIHMYVRAHNYIDKIYQFLVVMMVLKLYQIYVKFNLTPGVL